MCCAHPKHSREDGTLARGPAVLLPRTYGCCSRSSRRHPTRSSYLTTTTTTTSTRKRMKRTEENTDRPCVSVCSFSSLFAPIHFQPHGLPRLTAGALPPTPTKETGNVRERECQAYVPYSKPSFGNVQNGSAPTTVSSSHAETRAPSTYIRL